MTTQVHPLQCTAKTRTFWARITYQIYIRAIQSISSNDGSKQQRSAHKIAVLAVKKQECMTSTMGLSNYVTVRALETEREV